MKLRLSIIAVWLVLVCGVPVAWSSPRLTRFSDAWVKAKVDALVTAARGAYEGDEGVPAYEKLLNSIANVIERRSQSASDDFAGRYPEFVEYIKAASLGQQPDHELGFAVPDRQYFAETRQYVQIPEILLNQSFLRFVSRYETLDRAKSYLRQLNSTRQPSDQLLFFSYTSQHLGTPDSEKSYRRLLIVVPGNVAAGVPEKWVQFGVPDPGSRKRVRNVSVVSALALSDGTFNAYFKDSYRTFHRDGSISIKGRWELGHGDDTCVQCHKSGVLPIFPEPGSVSPSEQHAVSEVNNRFLTYGSPRFDKYLDETRFGPGLSSAPLEARARRFGAALGESTVGQAMNCVACHQPNWLGALNWPMDRTLISSYVKGGQMPLGSKLTVPERDELYDKLIKEYFATDDANPGILKSWLLGRYRK